MTNYPEVYADLMVKVLDWYSLFKADGIRLQLLNTTVPKGINRNERKDNAKGGDLP